MRKVGPLRVRATSNSVQQNNGHSFQRGSNISGPLPTSPQKDKVVSPILFASDWQGLQRPSFFKMTLIFFFLLFLWPRTLISRTLSRELEKLCFLAGVSPIREYCCREETRISFCITLERGVRSNIKVWKRGQGP